VVEEAAFAFLNPASVASIASPSQYNAGHHVAALRKSGANWGKEGRVCQSPTMYEFTNGDAFTRAF
jgi:hypothetical protein